MMELFGQLSLREKYPFWSFSGPYFLMFGLITDRYSVYLCTQSECGKIRTRKTPNTDTFHAVYFFRKLPWWIFLNFRVLNTPLKKLKVRVISNLAFWKKETKRRSTDSWIINIYFKNLTLIRCKFCYYSHQSFSYSVKYFVSASQPCSTLLPVLTAGYISVLT